MKLPDQSLYNHLVHVIQNKEIPGLFDVELNGINRLRDFHSFEFHFVLYPFSRNINADHFVFNPFEEYVNDIQLNQKSAYSLIKTGFDKLFGVFLGFLLFIIFYIFKPSDLFSVQSVVSVIGAYAIGKEIWDDIEDAMIRLSEPWKIRYMALYYRFRLESNSTQSQYTQFAKKHRYGKSAILPEKMDFIQLSNSQTLRLYFLVKNLLNIDDTSSHVLSFRLDPQIIDDFLKEGYGLGIKLSFNKRFFKLNRCFELFQSFVDDSVGCLDKKGQWLKDTLFYRRTFNLGRIKYFVKQGFLKTQSLLSMDVNLPLSHK